MSEMSATEYRKLIGATDGPSEMSAEQFNRLKGGAMSVSDHIGKPHSSEVNTESKGKIQFREWLAIACPHDVVEELRFLPPRRFLADWAVPDLMIVFEWDGFTDHATLKGMLRDTEKGNLAQLAGWMFIRLNAKSVKDGTAFEHAEHAILKRLQEREAA